MGSWHGGKAGVGRGLCGVPNLGIPNPSRQVRKAGSGRSLVVLQVGRPVAVVVWWGWWVGYGGGR